MPFKPLSLGLTGALLPPPGLLPQVLPTMTPPVKGANNVASTSRRLYRVVCMVVFARFRSAAPSLTRDPSQRAKSFAQNGEGLKTSLGWRVQPIFPFCVGRDGFPPICPCPHEGRYTRYEVLVWLTLRGKNFVACKIATTYGEDLSLEGGVVLYNTSILI